MHYERAEPGSETKTYAFLYNFSSRRIERNRQNNNRSALIANRGNDIPNEPGASGPTAKAEGRGKSRGQPKGRDGGGGGAPPVCQGGQEGSIPAPSNACSSRE